MLVLSLSLVLGQLAFSEHPLPHVVIGNETPFTGNATTNFQHADIDHDGDQDLLLPGLYALQEEGIYTEFYPLPEPPRATGADFFGGRLYLQGRSHLWVFDYDGDGWRCSVDQEIAWPGEETGFGLLHRDGPGIQFRRFLQDFDGDGLPELVALDHRGAHLFRFHEGRYVDGGQLPLPATTLENRSAPQAVWPPSERSIRFPEQQMSCRLLFNGAQLQTVSVSERHNEGTRYTVRFQSLTLGPEGQFETRETGRQLPELLPAFLRPCRLNGDDTVDFAGGRWLRSDTGPVPTPLYELWATLDGGTTFQIRRAAAISQFRPHCAFVDFDGDGDLDMVTESTQWPRGSLREQLSRFLTESEITHIVSIYRQENGLFSEQPALRREIEITLDSPPVQPGTMTARYEAGSLVNLLGDMNGDGFRDLLVRSGPKTLDVYLARGWKGFGRKPDWTLTISPDREGAVADLNGDGRSDIHVYLRSQDGETSQTVNTAYYAMESRP